jgi:hypothetical protein
VGKELLKRTRTGARGRDVRPTVQPALAQAATAGAQVPARKFAHLVAGMRRMSR